jgi:hypothetical protein
LDITWNLGVDNPERRDNKALKLPTADPLSAVFDGARSSLRFLDRSSTPAYVNSAAHGVL